MTIQKVLEEVFEVSDSLDFISITRGRKKSLPKRDDLI
jgi:hypothetical protein